MEYVSRAGKKLEHALSVFKFSPGSLICADFGSSTGGFVDCLLQHGAKKVYAVETGYGILDWKLRTDERVVVLEKNNAMHVILPEAVKLITVDTSWTMLEKVVPNVLVNLADGGHIIALIKPHYEAEKHMLFKGRLKDEYISHILDKIKQKMLDLELEILGEVESPIVGEKGKNREFLIFMQRTKLNKV